MNATKCANVNDCGKYLLVNVLRDASGTDCTLGGVSARYPRLYAPHPRGPFDLHNIDAELLLEVIPEAFPGCGPRLKPRGAEVSGQAGALMFGGNFVTSSDSRFSELYGRACPVHDRIEPWRNC